MTFDPPTGPPAGWYPDPEHPGHQRWWDGRQWAPAHLDAVAERDYPDVGDLLGRAFTRALRHWRSYALVALATSVVSGVLVAVMFRILVRDLVVIEGEILGWSNGRLVPVIVLLVVAMGLGVIGYLAGSVLALRAVDMDRLADPRRNRLAVTTADELTTTRAVLGATVRLLPRAIGWYLLMMLVVGAGVVILALVFVAVVPIGVLLVLVLIPFGVWLTVRYSFLNLAIADGPGNPFSRSADIVTGRWWATLGRFIVLGIVTAIISFGVNGVSSAAGGGGFVDSGPTFEIDADGTLEQADLEELAPSVPAMIAGAIASLVTAVLANGVMSLALADMYRTRRQRPAL